MDPKSSTAAASSFAAVDGYDISAMLAERDSILKDVKQAGALRVFGYGSLVWRPSFPFIRSTAGFVHGYVRRFWQASPDHRGTRDSTGRVCVLVKAQPAQTCHGTLFEIAADDAAAVLEELFVREKAGYRCERVEVHCPPEAAAPGLCDPSTGAGAATASSCIRDDAPPFPTLVVPAITFTADETSPYWAGPRTSHVSPSSSSLISSEVRSVAGAGAAVLADGDAAIALAAHDASAVSSSFGVPSALTAMAALAADDVADPSSPAALGRVIAFAAGPSGTNLEYFLKLLHAMRSRGVRDPHMEEILVHVLRHRGAAGLETPLPDGVAID